MSHPFVRSPQKRTRDRAVYMSKMDTTQAKRWKNLEKSPEEVERQKEIIVRTLVSITREKYPNLLKQPYLIPPVHFRRVTFEVVDTAGTVPVKVPVPATQMSNVREDETQQRIHNIMAAMFQGQSSEVMIVQFGLEFDNYLNNNKGLERVKNDDAQSSGGLSSRNKTRNEQREKHQLNKTLSTNNHKHDLSLRWSTSNGLHHHNEFDDLPIIKDNGHHDPVLDTGNLDLSLFSRPRELHSTLQRGRFDILIIHRDFGVMIFEVKAVGDAFGLSEEIRNSVSKQHAIIRDRLQKSLKQLNKEEIVLRFLLKDLGLENVHVTKGLVLPNLSKQTVRLALMEEPSLMKLFIECLNVDNVNGDRLEHAMQRCVFSDYLPPVGNSLDQCNETMARLYNEWWRNITMGMSEHKTMSDDQYEAVVSRFCGPATSQLVPSAYNERSEVSTLPYAIMEVSRCYKQLVVNRKHLEHIRVPHKHVWLTGQTGSNTEVLLLLKALKSLREGRRVLLLSLWHGSDAVTRTLYNQILNYTNDSSKSQLRFLSSNGEFRPEENIAELLHDLIPVKLVSSSSSRTPTDYKADNSLQSHDLQVDSNDLEANTDTCTSQTRVENDSSKTHQSDPSTRAVYTPRPKAQGHNARVKSGAKRIGTGGTQFSVSNGWASSHDNRDLSDNPLQEGPYSLNTFKNILIIAPQAAWFFKDIAKIYKRLFSEVEIWASCSFSHLKPDHFYEINLPQVVRRPPVVVKEAMTSTAYATFSRPTVTSLDAGTLAGMPHPTDGPAVKRLSHAGHGTREVWDCQQCGKDLALYLTEDLQLGSDIGQNLQYNDVLISGYFNLPRCRMDSYAWKELPGFLKGLEELSVPFTVFGQKEGVKLADAEKGPPHCLQVVHADCLLGLERPVVVVLAPSDDRLAAPRYVDPWYDVVSCCTAQLVVVGELASNGANCQCPFGSFIEAILKELTT